MASHFFVANTISLLFVLYTGIPLLIASTWPGQSNFLWVASVLVAPFSAEAIKKFTRWMGWIDCCTRPTGAKDCDIWNRNGDQSGNPGFPSGHLATTAAFWTGAYLVSEEKYKPWVLIVGIVGIMGMIWARMQKRCHTFVQTIAGTLLGAGIAYGFLRLLA